MAARIVRMPHKIAKLMLEHADTFLERTEAIETALYLGMPLQDIEDYLDWLDLMKSRPDKQPSGNKRRRGDGQLPRSD